MRNRFSSALLLLAGILLLGGCVNIAVLNITNAESRVLIKTPDNRTGYTKVVGAGESIDTYSSHGGRYTLSTLPNEAYRRLLLDLQEQLADSLFTEAATLSPSDVTQIVQRIGELNDALNALSREGASCTGSVPDFSSVTAVLDWDESAGAWSLVCSVSTSD
ncbi:MAG: hypothetical protein KBG20_14030 [Caldilineaceae bacterium]|nr:hypothetical protein [Caldilineaceae bacterium]MBP8106752.1 hypothetical protein [Caldilineaceae bacterium]MBP8123377.1 hypothetical protein [Caldilineaceae bacterium]MBP9073420.1 hypothetical protein [Caldilineaceae bacterium]